MGSKGRATAIAATSESHGLPSGGSAAGCSAGMSRMHPCACLPIHLFIYLIYGPDLSPPHSRRCRRREPAEDERREGGGRPPRCPLRCPGAGPETTLPLPSSMARGSPRSCLLEPGGCSPFSDPRGAEYLHRPLSKLWSAAMGSGVL